jgi:hypothetical protein
VINKIIIIIVEEYMHLKGHGNEADFLDKSVWHGSLTLNFEPFLFWLRIRRDVRNRKTTPCLAVDKMAYRYNFFQTFK